MLQLRELIQSGDSPDIINKRMSKVMLVTVYSRFFVILDLGVSSNVRVQTKNEYRSDIS